METLEQFLKRVEQCPDCGVETEFDVETPAYITKVCPECKQEWEWEF